MWQTGSWPETAKNSSGPCVRDDEGKESFIEIGDELEDNWKQHYTKKEASLVTQ